MALTLDLFVRKRLTYQDLNNKIQIPIQNYINQKCVIQDEVSAGIAANKIIRRDANGRAKVAAPVENDDIARLDTVKAVTLDSIGAASKTHTHTRSQITNFSHTHTRNEITDFNHTHSNATTSAAGFMSASDKTKLNAITIEKIAVGNYSGNGNSSWRNISVGFSPKMVIVGTSGPDTSQLWFATSSGSAHTNIEVNSSGFRVRAEGSTTSNPNRSGSTFRYCAIR